MVDGEIIFMLTMVIWWLLKKTDLVQNSGKNLLVGIIENNKINSYLGQVRLSKG